MRFRRRIFRELALLHANLLRKGLTATAEDSMLRKNIKSAYQSAGETGAIPVQCRYCNGIAACGAPFGAAVPPPNTGARKPPDCFVPRCVPQLAETPVMPGRRVRSFGIAVFLCRRPAPAPPGLPKACRAPLPSRGLSACPNFIKKPGDTPL